MFGRGSARYRMTVRFVVGGLLTVTAIAMELAGDDYSVVIAAILAAAAFAVGFADRAQWRREQRDAPPRTPPLQSND